MLSDTTTCEKTIRRLRSRMFDYDGDKADQAGRIIRMLKARCEPTWRERAKRNQELNMRAMWM